MKLYNNTAIPDDLLEFIIKEAAKAIKPRVRHGNVVVKVNRAGERCSGFAERCDYVAKSWLSPRRYKGDHRRVKTDKGLIVLRVPKAGDPILWDSHLWREPLHIASKFFDLCLHEWGHILDFQKGERFGDYNRRWANRPHERRAECYMEEARERGLSQSAQTSILDLAVHLESEAKGELK